MALRLSDKWLWDFWLAKDGPDYHVFYLQAPCSLKQQKLRHWNVSVGHAVSQDLHHWTVLPDALHPGQKGEWDDYTTWTGSIIKHQSLWYLFYTSVSRADDGLVQRIGLATSTDLIHWERHPANPLILADPHQYEQPDPNLWPDHTWRDPWVFQHPQSGDFHAFITARLNHGSIDGRGVIAHARSNDLIHWEVLPPVTAPGLFSYLEVPQLVTIQNRYYLLFCTAISTHAADYEQQTGVEPVMGTHYLVGDNPLGPFRFSTHKFLVGDPIGSFYNGKLVQGPGSEPSGAWYFMASRQFTPTGDFIGALSDPMPVTIKEDGNLSVNWQEFL
jgi:beta-fructofuranosidase